MSLSFHFNGERLCVSYHGTVQVLSLYCCIAVVHVVIYCRFMSTCVLCQDFDLCVPCYDKLGHPHTMDRLGFDLEDGTGSIGGPSAVGGGDDRSLGGTGPKPAALSAQEARRRSIQTCLQSLVHACHCRDANCRLITCQKMKRLIQHSNACRRKNASGCPVCKQLIALCCYHAKTCDVPKCPVPYCCAIREKLDRQRAEQRLKQAQLMRRRMALMQRGIAMETSGNTPVAAETVPPATSSMPPSQPSSNVYFRDKNAQFVGMGHTVAVMSGHQSPVFTSLYNRTMQAPYSVTVSQPMYERHQPYVVSSSGCSNIPMTLGETVVGGKATDMLPASAEFAPGMHDAVRHASMMNSIPMSSPAGFCTPRLAQHVSTGLSCH